MAPDVTPLTTQSGGVPSSFLLVTAVEDYRTEGRAVLLVGDLNLVADPVKDMHPGLRCAWDEREVEWFARVLGPYLDAYRHLHPHKDRHLHLLRPDEGQPRAAPGDYGWPTLCTAAPLPHGLEP